MARKPFVMGVLLYSTTLILLFSALLTDSWIEDFENERIEGKTPRVIGLLSMSFVCCAVGYAMLAWRMYGKVGTVAKYIAMGCAALTGITAIVAVYTYSIDVPLEEDLYYGFGYYTTAAAGVNAFVHLGLMVIHEIAVHEKVNRDRLSDRQWRLVLSYAIFFIYIELGAACYSEIEGWPAANSLMFCIVTVASIGYGSVGGDNICNANFVDRGGRPSSFSGKIFTVFYAPVGFGLIGWFIKSVWDALIVEVEKTVRRRRRTVANLVKGRELQLISPLGRLFYGTFGTVFMLLCGGLLWSLTESWSYFEGFWFSFVTLTTIGYGDYVPNPNHYYFYFIYLMLGLGCVTYFVSAVSYFIVGSIDRKVARVHNGGQTVLQAIKRLGKDSQHILDELPPEQAQIFIQAFQNLRTIAIEDEKARFGEYQHDDDDDDSLQRHTIVMDDFPAGMSTIRPDGDPSKPRPMGAGFYVPPALSAGPQETKKANGSGNGNGNTADSAMQRLGLPALSPRGDSVGSSNAPNSHHADALLFDHSASPGHINLLSGSVPHVAPRNASQGSQASHTSHASRAGHGGDGGGAGT